MTDDDGIPPGLAAAWGLKERPGHGPKRGLNLERIVETAVDMAGEEGLAKVSMVRVAKRLGVSPMALYRYVASKDELLDLMLDAGMGPPPDGRVAAGWREWLTMFAWDYLNVLRAKPWLLQVPISGPPITPNQISWLEHGLKHMSGSGITDREALSVIMLIGNLVRGWAAMTASMAGSDRPEVDYASVLSRVLDPERFPSVVAAITSGAIDDDWDDGDDEFRFGLARVLDGVARLARPDRG